MIKGDMKFFGSVTIGERGQLVVPADARAVLDIKPGDKLLVFKAHVDGAFVVAKPEEFERLAQHLSQQAAKMQQQLKRENQKSEQVSG